MEACSRLWPNGSTCQPIFGAPFGPMVSLRILENADGSDLDFSWLENRRLPQTPGELVDCGLVIGASLVVHRPSAANHLDLSALHEVYEVLPSLVRRLFPPHPEERGLDLHESNEMQRGALFAELFGYWNSYLRWGLSLSASTVEVMIYWTLL